jgi:CheY-like chemotaxis protein
MAGCGSTFRLEVAATPGRVTDDVAAAVSAPEQIACAADQESPLVVIIEDDPLAQDLVTRVLAPVGFRVRGATSARAGLELVRDLRPSLIILDIELPDLSGWQVLELCRADAACKGIPIVFVSVDDDRARAVAFGACDHMAKPID